MHGKSLSAQRTHFVISDFLQFQSANFKKSLAGKHLAYSSPISCGDFAWKLYHLIITRSNQMPNFAAFFKVYEASTN